MAIIFSIEAGAGWREENASRRGSDAPVLIQSEPITRYYDCTFRQKLPSNFEHLERFWE
jgi:hypothetical protein